MLSDRSDVITVADGEYPFYVQEEPRQEAKPLDVNIPLDFDAYSGLKAVTATVAGPNKLVATTSAGLLPTSIIPSVALGFVLGRDGVTQYNLVVEDDGALSIDPA